MTMTTAIIGSSIFLCGCALGGRIGRASGQWREMDIELRRLRFEQRRDIALILDHFGLEVHMPAAEDISRRLVPKVQHE